MMFKLSRPHTLAFRVRNPYILELVVVIHGKRSRDRLRTTNPAAAALFREALVVPIEADPVLDPKIFVPFVHLLLVRFPDIFARLNVDNEVCLTLDVF